MARRPQNECGSGGVLVPVAVAVGQARGLVSIHDGCAYFERKLEEEKKSGRIMRAITFD